MRGLAWDGGAGQGGEEGRGVLREGWGCLAALEELGMWCGDLKACGVVG